MRKTKFQGVPKKMKKILTLCVLLSLGALNMFAQAGLSAITGSVHDASGSVVPAAKVVIANESKGIRREIDTTNAGVFNAPALVPADGYSIEVSKPGFSKSTTKDISLTVGQTLDIPVSLSIATAAVAVNVTAESPVVDAAKIRRGDRSGSDAHRQSAEQWAPRR